MSPLLCLRLVVWRVSLPALKHVVPMRLLTRFMWSGPSIAPDGLGSRDAEAQLESLSYVWQHGGRLLVSPNCLERSLVLYRLLSQAGSNPVLVFGVSRDDSGLDGHAWVEADGCALCDDEVHRYDRLATFGANGRPSEIRPESYSGRHTSLLPPASLPVCGDERGREADDSLRRVTLTESTPRPRILRPSRETGLPDAR